MRNLTTIAVIVLLGIAAVMGFVYFKPNGEEGGIPVINREELAQMREKLGEMEAQLGESRQHISQLHAELQSLRRDRDRAESNINELKSTCNALISEFKEEIEKQEIAVTESEQEISVSFLDRILFDFGSASITPQGTEVLTRVGEILRKSHSERIRIVGHTDNVPIASEYQHLFPSNWELSAARAAAVARFFQGESGLEPERMEIVGYSLYNPRASNETEEGRARNRRVEILLIPRSA
jgi:chemotaxis protein MotB